MFSKRFVVVCIFMLCLPCQLNAANGTNYYGRNELSNLLLKSYNPGLHPPGATIVTLRPRLLKLINLDTSKEQINLYIQMAMYWFDSRLVFSDYSNTTEYLYLPIEKVWRPDIAIHNLVDMFYVPSTTIPTMYISVSRNGLISWSYPAVVTLSCDMNAQFFPYDFQNCSTPISSWVMHTGIIQLKLYDHYLDVSNYAKNGIWQLAKTYATKQQKTYSCCPYTYDVATYGVVYVRRSLYFVVNLIIPTCVLMITSIIGIFTPSNSGDVRSEKVSVGVAVMLTLSVLLVTINDTIPVTSNSVPTLSVFIVAQIVIIVGAIVATVLNMRIQRLSWSGKCPPSWVFSVLLLDCKRCTKSHTDEKSFHVSEELIIKTCKAHTRQIRKKETYVLDHSIEITQLLLTHILRSMEQTKIKENEKLTSDKIIAKEWIRLANRMDLLCMLVFMFFFFASVFIVLVPFYITYEAIL